MRGGEGEVRGVLMAFWVRKGMGQREGEGGGRGPSYLSRIIKSYSRCFKVSVEGASGS